MTSLRDFIAARLDEDEAAARAATPGPWRYNPGKHYRRGWTVEFEESVFAGPSGDDATSIALTGESDDPQSMADAVHIARHDPARVLREVAAKRDIIAAYRPEGDPHPGLPCTESIEHDPEGRDYDEYTQGPCERHVQVMNEHQGKPHASEHVLRYLAAPYSDHEAYQAEWRIE